LVDTVVRLRMLLCVVLLVGGGWWVVVEGRGAALAVVKTSMKSKIAVRRPVLVGH
jgi:hypothetical protein